RLGLAWDRRRRDPPVSLPHRRRAGADGGRAQAGRGRLVDERADERERSADLAAGRLRHRRRLGLLRVPRRHPRGHAEPALPDRALRRRRREPRLRRAAGGHDALSAAVTTRERPAHAHSTTWATILRMPAFTSRSGASPY